MEVFRETLYLAGQTGSGKSAVALELSRQLGPVEIINADAFQIYRGMECLTAAPTEADRAICPHHLFGVLDPSDVCDAATFADLARAKIKEVSSRAIPIVVGGGGLYLKSITHGLAPTPKGDPALRSDMEKRSLEDLVNQYRFLDPEGAEKTNLKNRRYVSRNLEISLLSGKPASLVKREWETNQPRIAAFYLNRERDDVFERINSRTQLMFQENVVEEVAALGALSATAAKAIGVREILAYQNGESDLNTCIMAIQQATRRYAKRQETWFRREVSFEKIDVGIADDPATTAWKIAGLFRDRLGAL